MRTRMNTFALRMAAMACTLAVGSAGAQSGEPIRIGSLMAITGPASFIGDAEAKAVQAFADQINTAGGVLGRKLLIVTYDDASDANKARTLVTRLVEQDKVIAVVGGSQTGSAMAMISVLESAEIPLVGLGGGVSMIEPLNKWMFKASHTDRMACEKNFADMKKRGLTKIAMLAGTDAFGASMREQCLKVVGNYGIQILVDQMHGPTDTDVVPQLSKIKSTPGVQAVMNVSGLAGAMVTRNYAQLGMGNMPLYLSHAFASNSYLELAGKTAEGVRLPAPPMIVAERLPSNDPQKPVLLEVKAAYEKVAKQPASAFAGYGYDGLMLIVNAIKKANSTDPAKIRDAIEQTKGFVGTSGIVNMSPKDHLGLTVDAFRMVEVRNGGWTLVD
jgi:branched-chain amino acid transport system substrate-binding protein